MNLHNRHPRIGIGCLCELFGKTRLAYYKRPEGSFRHEKLRDRRLLDMVNEIRAEAPGIGAYKLFLILRQTFEGRMVGRNRFYDFMHRHHLMLTPERRKHTTNSNHMFRKYRNLTKGLVPSAPCRLWVADITYIDTVEENCYLHLVTDAFTHEIMGWALTSSLCAKDTLQALEQAVANAGSHNLTGLIHHSDRGIQYCSQLYSGRLKELGILISMTEDSNPTDNAIAERVNGIIKQEWLYRMPYPRNLKEARKTIASIISFYNKKRPHMSNGMKTPYQMRKMSLENLELNRTDTIFDPYTKAKTI